MTSIILYITAIKLLNEMEFLKALHEAESFGVPRDVFMTAWERESQLMQAKEEARVLELKHSMNNGSNHDHGVGLSFYFNAFSISHELT